MEGGQRIPHCHGKHVLAIPGLQSTYSAQCQLLGQTNWNGSLIVGNSAYALCIVFLLSSFIVLILSAPSLTSKLLTIVNKQNCFVAVRRTAAGRRCAPEPRALFTRVQKLAIDNYNSSPRPGGATWLHNETNQDIEMLDYCAAFQMRISKLFQLVLVLSRTRGTVRVTRFVPAM